MSIFGICFISYFLKLSACRGFLLLICFEQKLLQRKHRGQNLEVYFRISIFYVLINVFS